MKIPKSDVKFMEIHSMSDKKKLEFESKHQCNLPSAELPD